MDTQIRFGWLALYRLGRPFFRALSGAPLFRLSEPSNYFKRISASANPSLYHPIDLEPTNILHRRLRNALKSKFGISVREKNFPYEIEIPSFGRRLAIGASIQAFLPDLLSIRIDNHTFCPLDETAVFNQRRLDSHPVLLFVMDFLVGLVQAPSTDYAEPKRLQVKPFIYLHASVQGSEYLAHRRVFLAALLINDALYTDSNPAIFERVLQKNDAHNQKGEKARIILLSKQGFLCLTTPNSENYAIIEQEIKKKERLFVLGIVLSNFYDNYTVTRRDFVREMDYLFFSTMPYIKNPELTFQPSASSTLGWSLIMSEFKLREAFDSKKRFDMDSAAVMSHLFDRIPIPKYSSDSFWEQVDRSLGEDYVSKQSGGIHVTIGTVQGAVAAGPHAQATSIQLDAGKFRQVVDAIADLRAQLAEDQKTAEFDALIAVLKRESAAQRPNLGLLRQSFASLRNIIEGTVGGLAASGLLYEGARLLGS
jgi:hypothetical protein